MPPTAIEESEDVPSTMPPADAEEIAPPTEMPMPQSSDEQMPVSPPMEDLVREQLDATRQHVFELWFDLFQNSDKGEEEANPASVTDEEPPSEEPGQVSGDKEEEKSEPSDVESKSEEPESGSQEESETVAPESRPTARWTRTTTSSIRVARTWAAIPPRTTARSR